MKKAFLLLLFSMFLVSVNAQTNGYEDHYKGIESFRELNLTSEQIAKIKKLKREVGPQFAAIGRDRSLSGYEKGQQKKALALKHSAEIESILTKDQLAILENKYGKLSSEKTIRNIISDKYEDKTDALERKYKAEKEAIENNSQLTKDEIKAQKEALKTKYKTEKDKLKTQKNASKRIY